MDNTLFPYKPHGDRVIILPDPVEKILPSGLIIPDTAAEKPQTGVIIALGEELTQSQIIIDYLKQIKKHLEIVMKFSGTAPETIALQNLPVEEVDRTPVAIGETVVFGKMAGMEIEVNKVKYLVIRYADIWASLK